MTDITPTPTPSPSAAEPATRSAATFEVLPLSREVRETLAEIGYQHPTPVQLAVWEPATRGRDAVVQARTGTGKTAAFGLPIVDHLVRRSMAQAQVLALCPTRELALQVSSEIERLGKKKNVRVTAIYGGAPMQRQIDAIADGAQVIVGTPGRVLDHLRRGTLDPKHIRLLVLDEADEMLSMGFEREVTSILDSLPKERQTLLFSATLPPDIERMAKKLREPEYLTLSGDHVGALEIEHFVYLVPGDKLSALTRVIEVENPESAVVFCNTKDETERVAQTLARQGYDASWLNGDLPQSDREQVMSKTREGRLRFLVATDVAARGIDISHLTHVINFDFPQDAESYVHRTGRTGRAGRTGTAISLITPRDVGGLYLVRLTYKIRPVERQIPTEGELKTRAEADLVAMLAEAFSSRGAHADDLALARRLLTHEQCDLIVAGLLRDHLGARPDAQRDASTARKATRRPEPRPERPEPRRKAPAAPVAAPTATASPRVEPVTPRVEPVAPRVEPVAPVAPSVERVAPVAPPVEPVAEAAAPPAELPREDRRDRERRGPRPEGDRGPRFEGDRGPRPEGDRGSRFDGDRGPRSEGDRGPRLRGRDRGPEGRRPRGEGRPREDHIPVSAADGKHEGDSSSVPTRHADFITWQPPAEEGDDEPILGSGEPRRPRGEGRPIPAPFVEAPAPMAVDTASGDFAEIYVNVGRREGARAGDFLRILTEQGGLDKANLRRIRVRERNAFVSVRREDLAKALEALTGATVAGKTVSAEIARERSEGEGAEPGRGPAPEDAPAPDTTEVPVAPAVESIPSAAAPDADVESDAVPTGRTSAG